MIRRRAFVAGMAAVMAGSTASSIAQQSQGIRRIGGLGTTKDPNPTWVDSFRSALANLGWREGHDFTIETRNADGRLQRLPELAAELVSVPVDVIVSGSTAAALAGRKATSTIPIVMVTVSDPVGTGLVSSLARPGGNVTGLAFMVGSQTVGKYVEFLKQAAPT